MRLELPSLNGLRAFEAAARHGGIKAAAAELFVTPGAVSQQIKALEEEMGVRLFARHPRGVSLTAAGEAFFPSVRDALRSLAGAAAGVREREHTRPLNVSLPPSLAMKWLVPRLGRLRDRHPELDVRIGATTRLVDFSREDVDLAIRCTTAPPKGLHAELLMHEDSYPVISPTLLAQGPPLRKPADLRHYTLLHDESNPGWEDWARLHGVTGLDLRRGPIFPTVDMALQAAVEGQGVAIAYTPLAYADMAEGRLVQALDLVLANAFAYYLVCPEDHLRDPRVQALRTWLLDEAEQDGGQAPREPLAGAAGGRRVATPDVRGKSTG